MYYEIYIDKLWFMDFIINTYLLLLVRETFGLKCRIRRLLLAAAGNAAAFVTLFLLPGPGSMLKLFIQLGLINLSLPWAAFSLRTKERIVKSYFCMNGYGLLLGGATLAVTNLPFWKKDVSEKLSGIFFTESLIFLAVFAYLYFRRKEKSRTIYRVELDFYGEKLSCAGLLDSGNSLFEPYGGRPVSILEEKTAGELAGRVPEEKRLLIPYHSIGKSHGILPAVELPEIIIDTGEEKLINRKAVVALCGERLSGTQRYQMILHPEYIIHSENIS